MSVTTAPGDHGLTAPAIHRDLHQRRRPKLLSNVDRVVREFLHDDERPIGDGMAGLSDNGHGIPALPGMKRWHRSSGGQNGRDVVV
jgi:hypothetical protein